MLWRYRPGVRLRLAGQQVSHLRHIALRHHARQVRAARPEVVARLVRLVVLGAHRRRAEHPGHLAVRTGDLAIDGVGRKVGKATALGQAAHARAAEAAPLRVGAAEGQPFAPERIAVFPRRQAQAHHRLWRVVIVGRQQAFAIERAELIFEDAFRDAPRSHQAGAAAWREIVDQRALDEILIHVRAQFFLAERLFELPEAQLQLVDAMHVDIKIAQQRARRVGEIAFDFEVEITGQPPFC